MLAGAFVAALVVAVVFGGLPGWVALAGAAAVYLHRRRAHPALLASGFAADATVHRDDGGATAMACSAATTVELAAALTARLGRLLELEPGDAAVAHLDEAIELAIKHADGRLPVLVERELDGHRQLRIAVSRPGEQDQRRSGGDA